MIKIAGFWLLIEPINKNKSLLENTRRTLFVNLAKRYKLLVIELDKDTNGL